MNLYILRHAIAEPRGTPGFEKDAHRPPTKEGERKMRNIADGIRALGIRFDRILASPYIRARRTAEIVAAVFEQEIEISTALTPQGNPHRLIAELSKTKDESLLVVGHEPYLSELISVLICGHANAMIELKKGALCKLSTDQLSYGQCAILHWLLAPAQLRGLD